MSEDNLNLENTKISRLDIHLIYLVSQYLPIYSENGMWQKFIEQNKWLNKYLPNFKYDQPRFLIKSRKKLINFGLPERFYKNIQLKKMAPKLKAAMNKGDKKVIINDQMLKLHLNDKRDEINRQFEKQ